MSSRHNARKAAVQALYQWDLTSQDADQIEKQFRQIHDMQNIDKKYLREILSEVPKLDHELIQVISEFIDRGFTQLDPVERAILRIGAYELRYRKDVPSKVVINEMIELAKVFGSDHSFKFVNGVMDKMAKSVRPSDKATNNKTTKKAAAKKPAAKTAVKKAPKIAVKPAAKPAD